jgi:hypothetical protein
MGATYWIARTQVDLAELALAQRSTADARAHLVAAQRSVDQYGYGGLQQRNDRLAADL